MITKLKPDAVLAVAFFTLIVTLSLSLRTSRVYIRGESRPTAAMPALFSDGAFNTEYFRQLDLYLEDHFAARIELVKIYNSVIVNANAVSIVKNYIFDRKSNWILPWSSIGGKPPLSKEECVAAAGALETINDICTENGIKLYVLIVPDRGMFYGENVQVFAKQGNLQCQPEIQECVLSLPYVIYPYSQLKDGSKRDYVFFKTDHHWTEYGAFIGYQALMERIMQDFPDIPVAGESDFHLHTSNFVRSDFDRNFFAGHNFIKMNTWYDTSKLLSTQYTYFEPKRDRKPPEKNSVEFTKFYSEGPGRYRALLTGTSMSENLLQILPESFSEILYLRLNTPHADSLDFIHRYGSTLLDFKPDILIICITYQNIKSVKELVQHKNK